MIAREPTSIMELWGLTEDWTKAFFAHPDRYLQQYFDIPAWTASPNSAKLANDVLQIRKASWRESDDMGKILVCLSYIIGTSIIHENNDLKLSVQYRDGFLNEISIGNDSVIADIFSAISDFTNLSFILSDGALLDKKFDILYFIRKLKFRENKPFSRDHAMRVIVIRN